MYPIWSPKVMVYSRSLSPYLEGLVVHRYVAEKNTTSRFFVSGFMAVRENSFLWIDWSRLRSLEKNILGIALRIIVFKDCVILKNGQALQI